MLSARKGKVCQCSPPHTSLNGLNTVNRWNAYGSSNAEANINARQRITCDNVKAARITLFTIQVNTSGDPTSLVLQYCASQNSACPQGTKFFVLTSGTAIGTTSIR